MTDQHTPSPWEVTSDPYPDGTPYFRFVAGVSYATGRESGFSFAAIMREPDARLIAAAPEMFEALMRCRDFLDRNPELRMGGARELVCAAIDKATKPRGPDLRGHAGD